MTELIKITDEELKDKRLTGLDDTPGLSYLDMQARFDAHPDKNTEVINKNADIQNAINKELENKALSADEALRKKQDSAPGMGLYPADKVSTDNNFTNELKNKLLNIEEGANNYALSPAKEGALGGVKPGKYVKLSSDGTLEPQEIGMQDQDPGKFIPPKGKLDIFTGSDGKPHLAFVKSISQPDSSSPVEYNWEMLANRSEVINLVSIFEFESRVSGIEKNLGSFPVVESRRGTVTLEPNKFYKWGEVSYLNLSLGSEVSGRTSQFLFQFSCGNRAANVTFPPGIKWQTPPAIEPGKTYQVRILNGIGTIISA